MRVVGTNRRLLMGGVAVIVAVASVAYTVIATREVLDEANRTKSDAEIAKARLAPDTPGYFDGLNVNRRFASYTPPAASCAEGAMADLRSAADLLADDRPSGEALRLLERALARDPACVGAGRLLVEQLSRAALQVKQREWVATADARPGDAAAQLLAAYYLRATGDAGAYRAYLQRASAVNPDQPLLHAAWSYYWSAFANPRSVAAKLAEMEAEVRVTGDLTSIAGLVAEYVELGDDEAALGWCDRYYAHAPRSTVYATAKACARAAIRAGDSVREAVGVERIFQARSAHVDGACMHADLAATYAELCRPEAALAEAARAVAGGCEGPASGARRRALSQLGRLEEASEPPPAGRYWGQDEGITRALALANLGRMTEAREVIRGVSQRDDAGTSHQGMVGGERARRTAWVLRALLDSSAPADAYRSSIRCDMGRAEADRVVRAAQGYLRALMLDEARSRLDRALALDPKNAEGWVARVYSLSVDGRLDAAAEAGEAAIAAGVTDGGLMGNLGYVYQQLGRCDRAIPLYERARASIPLRESIYGNLVTCLEKTGRDREARAIWAFIPDGRPAGNLLWWGIGLVCVSLALYLGGKLALRALLPKRFGHLRFP